MFGSVNAGALATPPVIVVAIPLISVLTIAASVAVAAAPVTLVNVA